MHQERKYLLIQKYLNNTATEQEKELLLKWFRTEGANEIEWDSENPDEEGQVKADIYNHIQKHLSHKTERRINWYQLSAAAVVFLVFSVTLYFYNKPAPTFVSKKPQPTATDIKPGGNKAILTLADGSSIILENAANGIVANQNSTSISKTQDGRLIYTSVSDAKNGSPLVYNTISTPRGGQYEVILPDGSQVWLNAASSLRFPASFSGDSRNVELTGEAYFEVAKNSRMPFKVKLAGQTEVEVLGTHFNIMAYNDEASIQTTLLEGSVKIHSGSFNKTIVPGQQAITAHGTKNINVKQVDVDGVIAWRNGYFVFNNENIQSIMKKISRWYNVDVEYKEGISKKVFAGSVSRFETVSEVLDMLELTGSIHFKIIPEDASGKGGRIIVMQ